MQKACFEGAVHAQLSRKSEESLRKVDELHELFQTKVP